MTSLQKQETLAGIDDKISMLQDELSAAPNHKVHTPWWQDRMSALIRLDNRRKTVLSITLDPEA